MERFERSRVGFGGVDPRVLFIPERLGLTSLIGVAHRSDRCRGSVGFASGERLGEFSVVPSGCCFEFGRFWSSVGLFGGFGTSCTGLTGELHRPDRCRGLLWKFSSFASRDRSDRCCSPKNRCATMQSGDFKAEDTRRDHNASRLIKFVVAGHLSDGVKTKIFEFTLEGYVSLVS
jgi:hypothetical protein